MPELFNPPVALPTSDVGPNLRAAVISMLSADPELAPGDPEADPPTSGALGVRYIGARYAQVKEGKRQVQALAKAKRPAIVVWVTRGGSTKRGTMLRSTVYQVHLVILVDHGDNLAGEALALRIQDRAMALLVCMRGSGAVLEGIQLDVEPENENAGEFVLSRENPNEFMSESTVDLAVLWSEVPVEG